MSGVASGETKALLSRNEVANLIGVHRETVKRAERAGKLPVIVFNSRLKRYRREDVEAWIGQGYISSRS